MFRAHGGRRQGRGRGKLGAKSPAARRASGAASSCGPPSWRRPSWRSTDPPAELAALADTVRADGGAVLASYREPLGGHALLLVALPVDQVVPTPFQRDISDAHVRRLTQAMDKTKRFLDPIIAVREPTDGAAYWTPNGYHRLTALKELGAKSVLALLVPERAVAYQILALNIEKAHNLREKAIGVRRMYLDLLDGRRRTRSRTRWSSRSRRWRRWGSRTRSAARLSGGAYHPILRKADSWVKGKLKNAIATRRARAALLLAYDDAVNGRDRDAEGARVQQPLPARVRRRAHQPAAVHQGDAAAARGAAADDDQARARHGREQDQDAKTSRARAARPRRARTDRHDSATRRHLRSRRHADRAHPGFRRDPRRDRPAAGAADPGAAGGAAAGAAGPRRGDHGAARARRDRARHACPMAAPICWGTWRRWRFRSRS